MRLLCAADLHLGRPSSRAGIEFDGPGPSARDGWENLVRAAIHHQVAAVLLAGDLIDQSNKFFEAIGPFEAGVRELNSHGIRCLAVTGNHDHDVLPTVAGTMPEAVRLLGRGKWEKVTIEADDEVVDVVARSFDSARVPTSLLPGLPRRAADGRLTIGLLHGDLAVASVYNPLAPAELQRPDCVDAWVLGHIHKPGLVSQSGDPVLAFYPGSPQALDPGEPGIHGAYLLDTSLSPCALKFVPLSSIRYDQMKVPLSADQDDARTLLHNAARQHLKQAVDQDGKFLRWVSVRADLTGEYDPQMEAELVKQVGELADTGSAETQQDNAEIFIERVEISAQPAVDLDALDDQPGPVGILAGLQSKQAWPKALVVGAMNELRKVRRSAAYGLLNDDEPTDSDVQALLTDAAMKLLLALKQQEGGSDHA